MRLPGIIQRHQFPDFAFRKLKAEPLPQELDPGGGFSHPVPVPQVDHLPDPLSHVGIRVLNSVARDISYHSTLSMNYLTMHV